MERQQKDLLALVHSALAGVPAKLSAEFSLKELEPLILKHQLAAVVYNGAFLSGLDMNTQEMQDLLVAVYRGLSQHENQMVQLDRIYTAFDAAGIDYMPVKGAVIKQLYPTPDMRFMGDADILIRVAQYDKIRPILAELGFKEKLESDHELIWTHPSLYLELHKRLIPSYNTDYYAHFGDGWQQAAPVHGHPHRYALSNEEHFIFLFTHFAKHYRDGGIGIKHMLDFWLYQQKCTLDMPYVEDRLKQLQLYTFYVNIQQVLAVWFGAAPETERTAHITQVIFNSGAYGTFAGHALSQGVKAAKAAGASDTVRRKSILRAVFLPYTNMCERFPILRKLPILLPFFWVVRWFTAIFFRKQNIKRERAHLRLMAKANIDNYAQALQYVGLDFDFSAQQEYPLTANQTALLQFLSVAIGGQTAEAASSAIPFADMDWNALLMECAQQAVLQLVFDGAANYMEQMPEAVYVQWLSLATRSALKGMQVLRAQRHLVQIMEENQLPYFILKGAAAAAYYPKPDVRAFGDVDFLIDPAMQQTVEEKLKQAGYVRWQLENDCHVVYYKKGEHLEMHFEIAGIPHGKCGKKVRNFMSGAVQHYQTFTIENATFKMPIPMYHGLILLLHMQHHMLGEGIGLRHLCDWGCFVKQTYMQPFWEDTLLPFLQEIGLYTYAAVITQTCAIYLHTPSPDWAANISPALCYAVLQDILAGGNFGRKNSRRAQSSVLVSQHGKDGTQHGMMYNLLGSMHRVVISQYPILKKVPVLYPVFYGYRSLRFIWNQITGKRDPIQKLLPAAKERRALYAQLHIFETEK